jgi:hypothetical protein
MGDLDEPFPGSWALAAGIVSRWELRHNYVRLFPDVYVRRGIVLDAARRARAAAHWAKGGGILVGHSAAALLGTKWLDDDRPPEIAIPGHRRGPCGIRICQSVIDGSEWCDIDGFRVTTPARTAFDLGRYLRRDEAVATLDALCAATGLHSDSIADLAQRHPRARGLTDLANVLPVVDAGSESPYETRTRLLLIDDGLPRPETQVVVRSDRNEFIARLDLGWKNWRVAVEYDGAQHWTDPAQRTKDIDRIATLESIGWRIIRVSASLLHTRPHLILDRTRSALRAHGAVLDY